MDRKELIAYFEKEKYNVSNYAKSMLRSPDFKPTEKGTIHNVAILKGELFKNNERVTKNIRAEATRRKLTEPHPEVACLIRKDFSDEEIKAMDFWWIVVMHKTIKDYYGDPSLLSAGRHDDGRWLSAAYDNPDFRWVSAGGFAFAVSQELVLRT